MSGKAPYGYPLEPTLLDGIRTKKMAADPQTAELEKLKFDMSAASISPEQMKRTSNHLEKWEDAGFEDRWFVVDGLVSQIRASKEVVRIEWKI